MEYHALYRKYRPNCLKDVVGQENIIKILTNSLINNTTSHAYLFSGPRGTGKTTIAKILAKNLNCLDLKDGDSCGKCDNCKLIEDNLVTDIIEIDAASNNGVDEIREIRNNVNLVPSQLKYKVYIIDEVHMLSTGAFNALLKTLEEPPKHIVFILATTDLHKVPETIISRCQCFSFNRIKDDKILDRLKYICNEEKIDILDDVLLEIAKYSDGGLRDSLSTLDKLRSYTNKKITLDDFYNVNGVLSKNELHEFISSILNNDYKNVFVFSNYIYESGKDYIIVLQDILNYIRNLIMNYYVNNIEIEFDIKNINNLATKLNMLIFNLKNSSNIKIMFETSIISIISELVSKEIILDEKNSIDTSKVTNNALAIQKKEVKEDKKQKIKEKEKANNIKKSINFDRIINNTFATANKNKLVDMQKQYSKINDYKFDSKYSKVVSCLNDYEIKVAGDKEIILSTTFESSYNQSIEIYDMIEKMIEMIYNNKYEIALLIDSDWNNKKEEYIKNLKNGNKYTYIESNKDNIEEKNIIEEQTIISNDNNIFNEAINIFGEDIVTEE